MIKYKCKTCAGEYSDTCADDLAYYHSCPQIQIKEDVFAERSDKRDENAGREKEGRGREKII